MTLTPSPTMSPSLVTTSPIWMTMELDPPIRRQRAIAFSQGRLHFGRAAKRFDDAAELDEQPVAGSLDDAAAVLGDFGSRSSRRSVRRRCRVPPSSAPISRE
jgi:hypothetical protein